jgi:hypothetical protein
MYKLISAGLQSQSWGNGQMVGENAIKITAQKLESYWYVLTVHGIFQLFLPFMVLSVEAPNFYLYF